MYGNQPILEQPCKTKARKVLRASVFGYTLMDMVIVLVFLSLFGLSIPILKPNEVSTIEQVYHLKKEISSQDFTCVNNEVFIDFQTIEDVSCRVYLTYIRFQYKGYYFYEDKRI